MKKVEPALASVKKEAAFSVPKLAKPATQIVGSRAAWFLTPLSVSVFATMANSFKAAGEAADVPTKIYDSGTSATTENAAIKQAVNNNASFIVIDGIRPSDVAPGLNAAKKAGIPLVSAFEPSTTSLAKEVIKRTIAADAAPVAKATTVAALNAVGCKLNLAVVYTPAYTQQANVLAGIKEMLPTYCPSCTVTTAEYDINTAATSAGPQVSRLLAQHPDINVVFLDGPTLIPQVVPTLQSSKKDVKVISQGGTDPGIEMLKKGSGLYVADAAALPYPFVGWLAMDAGLRIYGNLPENPNGNPTGVLLTKDSNLSDPLPSLNGYEGKFTSAWNG